MMDQIMDQIRKYKRNRSHSALWMSIGLAVGLVALLAACMAPTTPAPADAASDAATGVPAEAATSAEAADTGTTGTDTADANRARIVVQLDESRLRVRTIEFNEPLSGLAALERSGLPLVTADFSWGIGVCSIAGVGCPAEDCFCGGDAFWNYAYLEDGAWQGYAIGATQSVISDTGAVEGWRWGTGDGNLPDPDRIDAVYRALAYAQAQQDPTDGSYAGSAAASVEMLLALAANQIDAATWQAAPDAPSLLDFVTANVADYSQESGGATGKLAVSLAGAGHCWPGDARRPSEYYAEASSTELVDAGFLAWAVLGMAALEEPIPEDAINALRELALPDGGWEWSKDFGRDTNTTSIVLQALAAAGIERDDPLVEAALAYLHSAQTESGGFSYDPAVGGGEADANSTAYVVQALAAWGEDPTSPDWQQPNGTPIDYLLSLQSENGALSWQSGQTGANLSATQQAIPALLGQAYPVQRRALPSCQE